MDKRQKSSKKSKYIQKTFDFTHHLNFYYRSRSFNLRTYLLPIYVIGWPHTNVNWNIYFCGQYEDIWQSSTVLVASKRFKNVSMKDPIWLFVAMIRNPNLDRPPKFRPFLGWNFRRVGVLLTLQYCCAQWLNRVERLW